MPIPRDQCEKGLDETRDKMLKFLTANPEQAYNIGEVAQEIYVLEPLSDWKWGMLQAIGIAVGIGSALDDLVRQGLVNKKGIGGITYYYIHRG